MRRARKKAQGQHVDIAILSAERKLLQARLAALDRDTGLRERGLRAGDNTPTSDTLDAVQEAMAKEEALKARDALIQRLKVLARAEEKLRDGTYGLCEACGKAIPPARLRLWGWHRARAATSRRPDAPDHRPGGVPRR
jgi:RNA polymerase-binding transcription factor DksA